MARPIKQGLDYFPMDVDADTDEKIEFLTAKCGYQAFGVYVTLLMKTYKNGYFLEWSERQLYVTAKRVMMTADELKSIVDCCIDVELFDKGMFEKFHILTSQSIQKRFLAATEKRKSASIGQYSLLGVNSEKTTVNSEETMVNSEGFYGNQEETMVNSGFSTQSKVKESKVNNNTTTSITQETEEVLAEAVRMFEDIVGEPVRSMTDRELLCDLVDNYTIDNIKAAMREAAKSGARARNLRYIEGCLKRWKNGDRRQPSKLSPQEKAQLDAKRAEADARYEAAERERVAREYGGAVNESA